MKATFPMTAALLLASAGATAEPVSGTLTVNGRPLAVSHVAAYLHDNVEGLNDTPLVLVFSDRPVPARALANGGADLPRLARAGGVRGLMFRIDPAQPDRTDLQFLDRSAEAEPAPLMFMPSSSRVIDDLRIDGARVSGTWAREIRSSFGGVEIKAALRFDAPLTLEPAVVADRKGRAAVQASAPFAVLKAWQAALARNDLAKARSMFSAASLLELDRLAAGPGGERAVAGLFDMHRGASLGLIKEADRLVERPDRAVVMSARGTATSLVKEGGVWKVGD